MTKKQAGTAPVEATALPKTRKSVTNIDVLHLKSVVQVCAFASEAQRILKGIDHAAKIRPEIADGISAHVDAPRNWGSFEAPIASALAEVALQLEQLADDIERAED